MEEAEELLCLLEKRLDQHDDNRKKVQNDLKDIYANTLKEADSLEEKANSEIHKSFDSTEERILGIISSLNSSKGGNALKSLINKVREELSTEHKYEIKHNKSAKSFGDSYSLDISSKPSEGNNTITIDYKNATKEDIEKIVGQLKDHLDNVRKNMRATLDSLAELCAQRREGADKLMERINGELEGHFRDEDARLQEVVKMLREGIGSDNSTSNNSDSDKLEELKVKAKATLTMEKGYVLNSPQKGYSLDDYTLSVTKEIHFDFVGLEKRKPSNLVVSLTDRGVVSLLFTLFKDDEIQVLSSPNVQLKMAARAWEKGKSEETARTFSEVYAVDNAKPISVYEILASDTTYCLKVRVEYKDSYTLWSEVAEFTTPGFKEWSRWRERPIRSSWDRKYTLNEDNPRIATAVDRYYQSTITGNTYIPINAITEWSVKLLTSELDNGRDIYVGVAPFDINRDGYSNQITCGWYFNCYNSLLVSGPPHNCTDKNYKANYKYEIVGKHVHNGYSIDVVMDTIRGELSFSINGKTHDNGYKGIPLDKPLVPCVLLGHQGDSVELTVSEVKTISTDSSIPVPSNATTKVITWNTITFTWDPVKRALNYQVEVDGDYVYNTTATVFKQRGMFPEKEYSFRVRAMTKSSVGEWSDVVRGRTLKAPEFDKCEWDECPNEVDEWKVYSVNEKNNKVVTKIGKYGNSTIIGNSCLPQAKVTSWNIKVLKSRYSGTDIYVGVAPSNIDMNDDNNSTKCGWYFGTYLSVLCSGPPHNYTDKEYGPRKDKCGKYVHAGYTIGVVMDTTKGNLSFIVNRKKLGVAYEGIPLDKPLAPCVILHYGGDSVELEI